MSKNTKPSIKRISEVTGFSQATVSNALSGKRTVNKETSEKIFQIAREMGYNMASKASVKAIKFVVYRKSGLILDESSFHSAVIEGVEAEAKAHGLSTVFVKLDGNSPDYDAEVRMLISDNESAIVLLATEMETKDFEPFHDCLCPIILLDGWDEEGCFSSVLIDNFNSAFNAVEYLAQKGHKSIGYLRGSCRIEAFKSREIGYKTCLLQHGLPMDENSIVTVCPRVEQAYLDMKEFLSAKPKLPTAFFADNDLIALGAIRALTEAGYSVPEDISIVGFDDLAYTAMSVPPLSTIHVNKQEMGREAVRRIIDYIENGADSIFKIASATRFVERESVKDIN